MAEKMNVPIIGLDENMAYFKCPGCILSAGDWIDNIVGVLEKIV